MIGIKVAAKRRVKYELNLDIETENIKFLDKIFYQADYDEIWGEYESFPSHYLLLIFKVDYVLFVK